MDKKWILSTLVLAIAALLTITPVLAQEEELKEIMPEWIHHTLGFIGFIFGLASIYLIIKIIKTGIGGAIGKALNMYQAAMTLLAIASIICFLGWISGLYSEILSVFIEDQLRFLSLTLMLWGSYKLYKICKG